MQFVRSLLAVFFVALVAGCATAPQMPVPLAAEKLGATSGRVGVVMSTLPVPDTAFPGAGCLLCQGAAALANSSLTTYARTLTAADLLTLKQEIVALLKKKGVNATAVESDVVMKNLPEISSKAPNMARRDFSSYKGQFDQLVVIDISQIGFTRSYSAYFPTSDPKAYLIGEGYMVDLSNNTFSWYELINPTKAADGKWDEPPQFPGLTNAYFQMLEMGRDQFKAPFSR
jgi:hypothetical protein